MANETRSTLKSGITSNLEDAGSNTVAELRSELIDIVDSQANQKDENTFEAYQIAKQGPHVDAHAFCEVDGSTEDSANLTDAATHAADNSLPLLIGPGSYYTSSTVDWSQDGLVVIGAGGLTRIIADQGSGTNVIDIKGASGSPLTNITLRDFLVDRRFGSSGNAQHIAFAWVDRFFVDGVEFEGTASAGIRGDNLTNGSFGSLRGKDLGSSQAPIAMFDCSRVQIGRSQHVGSSDTGEAVDIGAGCSDISIGLAYSENNSGDTVDIGASERITVNAIISESAGGAVTIKNEGGSSDVRKISVGLIIAKGFTNIACHISAATSNTDPSDVHEDISIGTLIAESTTPGAKGIVVDTNVSEGNIFPENIDFGAVFIRGESKSGEYLNDLQHCSNVTIGRGKIIDSGGIRSALRFNNADDITIGEGLTIQSTPGVAGESSVVSFSSCNGVFFYGEIIDGPDGTAGLVWDPSNTDDYVYGEISPKRVENVGTNGVYVRLPTSSWDGRCLLSISDGRYVDCDRDGSISFGAHVIVRDGSTAKGIEIDRNKFFSTRSSPTMRGTVFNANTGDFDYCARRDNDYHRMGSNEGGSAGANGVERTGVTESA